MSGSSPNLEGDQAVSSFSFQPPPGGNVTLKSSDGATFVAHSLLLSLASNVFSDMLTSNTTADVVELAEDAETVSFMLACIYPATQPPLDTVPFLEKAMLLSHKYDIEGLVKAVKRAGTQRELVRRDPARVYQAAGKYGFSEIETFSAKLVLGSDYDMTTVDGLVKFAEACPQYSRIIGVVGVHGARLRVLDSYSPDISNTLWPLIDGRWQQHNDNMTCEACWGRGRTYSQYKPGWLSLWFTRLHSVLINKPLDECDSYFELSYLAALRGETAAGCCNTCIDRTRDRSSYLFLVWAANTRSRLQEGLAKLDVLYTLDLS
ncbi:hypothetical protein FRC09_009363 [Ceratobasidium sp. 395]|nr:hypothetical protein FRC09_009363 [Ceratobasidium sp. 395]